MGFKDALKNAAAKAPVAAFGPFLVYRDRIKKDREEHPLAGVTATLEQGDTLQRRITATRLVTTGVFALKFRKKSGGEWWLTIEGPDFFWTEEVDRKKQKDAREFVAKINDQARKQG